MIFIKIHNLDRKVDEQINAGHISRIRDVQSRDEDKCTISFSNGDSMTALGTSEQVLAKIQTAEA